MTAASERDALVAQAVQRMGQLVRVFHRNFHAPHELELFELTMPQCRAVLFLADGAAAPMTKLAGGLGVSLPSATGLVDRLVEKGLVARVEDADDRRIVLCRLTDAGTAMADGLYEADVAVLRELLAALPERDVTTVLAAIDLLLAAARQAPGTPQDHQPA